MLLYQNLHSYYWLANSRLFGVETEGKKGDWIVKAVCKKSSVHYVSSTGYEETLGGGFGQIVLYSNSARVKKMQGFIAIIMHVHTRICVSTLPFLRKREDIRTKRWATWPGPLLISPLSRVERGYKRKRCREDTYTARQTPRAAF